MSECVGAVMMVGKTACVVVGHSSWVSLVFLFGVFTPRVKGMWR